MAQNLDQEHSVGDLANRVHMSARTFARRFRSETGATPAAWLNSQRVLRAQELLESTDLNIDEVARESGFGHPVLLRHHFAKVLDTSPQSYAGPSAANWRLQFSWSLLKRPVCCRRALSTVR